MGTVLRKFTPEGKLVWELDGHFFVDLACADPATDGADVWVIQEHYTMDYTRPPGQEAPWVGYSLDRHRYPDDPRGLTYVKQQGEHGLTSPQVVYLKGKRFLFVGGMFASNFINMFRYDGEIAVPSGVIMQWGNRLYRTDLTWLPNRPEGRTFIWRDTSGDGAYQADEYAPNTARVRPGPFWVDQRGDIWMAYGTFRYEFQGLDPTGNPIYRADKTTAWDPPEGMKDLARVWCDADRDMRVAAEQGVDKRGRADMRHIGRVFVCKGYKAGNRRAVSFRSGADREAGCVARVTSDQKATGGWGIEDPDWDVHACFDAVFVLRQLGGDDPKVSAAIGRGADWALHCRNTDGGFGHFPGRHSDMDAGYFQFGTLIQAGRVPGVRDLPDAHTLSWGHAMQPVRVYENRPLNPG